MKIICKFNKEFSIYNKIFFILKIIKEKYKYIKIL